MIDRLHKYAVVESWGKDTSMAIKKSELYSSLWASCDALRGGMDASQYKDYVLVMLFVKYVSDKYAGEKYAPITIPKGASFSDMVALKGKSDIGDQINKKILAPLATANDLTAFADFNDDKLLGSGKEMVDRLTDLIAIFENPALDFSKNQAEGDDILGDAYEYLMRHFATESGKSKGQFYTPAEVSRIMAQIIGIHESKTTSNTTVYDPTCGSGSLLLKVGASAESKVTLYGQEKDSATSTLAYLNMVLHDYASHSEIKQGNTLANPRFKTERGDLKTFDFVVANPPFSDKRWSTGLDPLNDPYDRFKHFGIPPSKQGDYAYLLHIIRSLKSKGKGACILPHGVLFRGNAEAEIRKNLIRKGFIKGIIGLPTNLFYGTGIPACILVLDKENAHNRKGIFMIDASGGFIRDGNKNKLRAQDIHKIVDVFNRRQEIGKYSRMVSVEEIENKNDFNLNIPRYIDSSVPEDIQDIEGHLRGGIPVRDIDALQGYWDICPSLRGTLLENNRSGYVDLAIDKQVIKTTIFEHPEFTAYMDDMETHFARWQKLTAKELKTLDQKCRPKEIIKQLSEDVLIHYKSKPLIEAYDVYQHMMDYWDEAMQDDCYLISADGWKAETYRVLVKDKKGKEKDKGWTCDLAPKESVAARYFACEQQAIYELKADLETAVGHLSELEEAHGSDEGALNSVGNKSDAIKVKKEAIIEIWQVNDAVSYKKYKAAQSTIENHLQKFEKLVENNSCLNSLANTRGYITQKSVNDRLKQSGGEHEQTILEKYKTLSRQIAAQKKVTKQIYDVTVVMIEQRLHDSGKDEDLEDLRVIGQYLNLTSKIGGIKSAIKRSETELDQLAHDKYPELSEAEIKVLVVDDKWLSAIDKAVHGEMNRINQALTVRIKELAEQYETPMPKQTRKVASLEKKMNAHLEAMGFAWK